MVALVAGILGGIIGGALVGLAILWQEKRLGRLRAVKEVERLTELSYRLWHLYVDLVSGIEISPKTPRALHEEVLLATSGLGCGKASEEALFAMTSLIYRAVNRAGEFRRVGLSVSSGQFADLTESMRKAFSIVQLGAATEKARQRARAGGIVADLSAARSRKRETVDWPGGTRQAR
jgi:hypothetical protein